MKLEPAGQSTVRAKKALLCGETEAQRKTEDCWEQPNKKDRLSWVPWWLRMEHALGHSSCGHGPQVPSASFNQLGTVRSMLDMAPGDVLPGTLRGGCFHGTDK